MRSVLLGGVLVLAPGCIPLAVPPAQVSVGGGLVSRVPQALRSRRGTDSTGAQTPASGVTGGDEIIDLEVSMHPMQFFDELRYRRFDVGSGYMVEQFRDAHRVLQGGRLTFDGYPLVKAFGSVIARVGVRGGMEVLSAGRGTGTALGGSFALVGEASTFIDKQGVASGSGGDGIAAAFGGELGIGAYAGVSYRRFHDEQYAFPSIGIYGLIPGLAGFVCCLR